MIDQLRAKQLTALLDSMGPNPPPGHNRYRVRVVEWLSYLLDIDATDEESAEELANEIWSEFAGDAFVFRDSGIDSVTVDLLKEGEDATE